MNKIVIGVIAAIIIVVGAIMLLGNKTQTQPAVTTAVATPMPTMSPTASPSGAMMEEATVTLGANGFAPQTITIKVGTKVTWTNKSGADATVNSDPHPRHTDYPPLNLGMMADGASVSLTFDKAGTYGYHNHLNPSETGTVIVK